LIEIIQRDAARLPGRSPFLDGAVIEVTGLAQLFRQEFSLLPGGIQAVFIGEAHDFPFEDWMYFPDRKFRFLFANGTRV
jgi:hypothetical protein